MLSSLANLQGDYVNNVKGGTGYSIRGSSRSTVRARKALMKPSRAWNKVPPLQHK